MNGRLKELLRKSEWFIIPAVLIVGSFFAGSWHGRQRAWENIEARADTVVKVVSVYKDFPQPAKIAEIGHIKVPTYKFITDTTNTEIQVVLRDTTVQYVYLPREQKYFEEADGKLRLWVSGYEPRLDRYELDLPTTTITNTVKKKPSRWSVSISGGYGICVVDKKVGFAPYIGAGISFNLINL